MDRKKILDKVTEIIAFQMNIDKGRIDEGQLFINDLGADSLDLVEILFEIEEAFDLNISDGQAEKLKTIKLMVDYLEENTTKEEHKCQEE